jgi:hypothetical protein
MRPPTADAEAVLLLVAAAPWRPPSRADGGYRAAAVRGPAWQAPQRVRAASPGHTPPQLVRAVRVLRGDAAWRCACGPVAHGGWQAGCLWVSFATRS